MKIKKKAKLPRLECDLCGCVFVPSKDDLRYDDSFQISVTKSRKEEVIDRVYVNCPVCRLRTYVFKENEK